MPETVYLDLETTGLYPPDDEILEIAVVDDAGAVLLHSLVRLEHARIGVDAPLEIGAADHDMVDARQHRYSSRTRARRMRGV